MKSHRYPRTVYLRSAEHKAISLALQGYRRQWQEASQDNNLHVTAPVGLVIADIAEILGLTSVEQRAVLGFELSRARGEFLKQHVRLQQ